jgi:hypothetical protein
VSGEVPIIKGVDHIYVVVPDAKAAYRVLTENLELPSIWAYASYGNFASGSVSFGNINIEVLQLSSSNHDETSPVPQLGIALRPVATKSLISELDHRRIDHSVPENFPPTQPNGAPTMWTNVSLPSISNPTRNVFTCEYHVLGMYDYSDRQAKLDYKNGGVLGVNKVKEVVIGSTRFAETIGTWKGLLEPLRTDSSGLWKFEHGPALRIKENKTETVQLVIETTKFPNDTQSQLQELIQVLPGIDVVCIETS